MTIRKIDIRHSLFIFCHCEPFDFDQDRLRRGISDS
jgi:hypothetical protein